jgi:hypothetical protein
MSQFINFNTYLDAPQDVTILQNIQERVNFIYVYLKYIIY